MARRLQFDVSALDRASAAFLRIAAAAEALAARLEALDGKRVEPEIVVQTREAEREVGRFATRMQRQIQEAVNRLPALQIKSNADTDALAALRQQLNTLSARRIGVDIDADDAKSQIDEIAAKLRSLAGSTTSVRVRSDAQAALRDLENIDRTKERISRTPVQIKTDNKGIRELINSTATLTRSLSLLATLPAVIAITPAVGALGNALVEATGVLGLIPGLLAAVGIVAGTAAIGFQNFTDAVDVSNLEKANEALAKLSPSAQQTAVAVRAMGAAWQGIQLATQEALFRNMGTAVEQLGRVYLPIARAGFTGVGAALNVVARDMKDFLITSGQIRVAEIFEGVRQAVIQASPGIRDFGAAILDVVQVGTSMLPRLAAGFSDVGARFRQFIADARESGRLEQWIQRGIDAVTQLGRILGNVGGSFRAVFAAAESAGAPLLDTLERGTAAMERFLKSGEGQAGLIATFQTIKGAVDGLLPGLTAIGRAILDAFQTSGPAIQQAAAALGQIAVALAPAIPAIAAIVSGLTPLLQLLAALVTALGPIPAAILTAVAAFRLLSAVGTTIAAPFAALGTRFQAVGQQATVMATSVSRAGTAVQRTGTFFTAAGTAVSAFARFLGGPITAAILTAVGLFSMLSGSASDTAGAFGAARAEIDQLRSTLDQVSGAVTQASVEFRGMQNATTEFANSGKSIAQVAQEMGVNLNDLASAQLGNVQATERVNAALTTHAATLVRQNALYASAQPQLAQYGISLETLAQAAMGSAPAMDQINRALQAIPDQNVQTALKGIVDQLLIGAAPARDFATQLGITAQQARQAAVEVAQTQAALANVGVAIDGAKTALTQYGSALDQTTGQVRAGAEGSVQLSTALQEVANQATASAVGAALAAEAQGNIAGAAAAAASSMQASRDAFITAATAALGSRDAAVQLADALGLIPAVAETRYRLLGAPEAIVQVGEILAQLSAVPGLKQVIVDVLAPEAIALLRSIGFEVEALPDGRISITADDSDVQAKVEAIRGLSPEVLARLLLDPAGFNAALEALIAQGNGTVIEPRVVPRLEMQPYDDLRNQIQGTPISVPLTMDTSQAQTQLAAFVAQANSVVTVSTHNLNVGPAQTQLAAFASAANGLQTRSTHDANTGPADARLAAFASAANSLRTTSTHNVTDNTAAVLARIRSLNGQNTTSTHTIRVVTVGGGVGAASGGVGSPTGPTGGTTFRPELARGGVLGMADGGMLGSLKPMVGGIAQVIPPNSWRVIGDRMRDHEAYIPINKSQRSQQILEMTARRMGYALLPNRGTGRAATSGVIGRAMSTIGGPSISDGKIDQLIGLMRSNRPIVVEDRTGNPVATARATALALRMF